MFLEFRKIDRKTFVPESPFLNSYQYLLYRTSLRDYFHSKASLLSSSTFVLLFENMLPYWNHCLPFWIGNIFLVLLSTYLENTGRNNILCVKMLMLKKESHMLILMIAIKIEMQSQENNWQVIIKNPAMI